MNTPDSITSLKDRFPAISEEANTSCLTVPATDIKGACQFLKENLNFEQLACVSAIDYKDRLALVYNIFSYKTKEKINLKVFLDKTSPSVESVTPVYPAANWHEREAFDMMGINFNGHPDPRRILLPDDWEGYPLRKDYAREGFVRLPPI